MYGFMILYENNDVVFLLYLLLYLSPMYTTTTADIATECHFVISEFDVNNYRIQMINLLSYEL